MEIAFGQLQHKMSDRMRTFPFLSKIINRIFGTTNVGQYARALSFKKLIGRIDFKNTRDVLDLGCGQGEYLFSFASGHPTTAFTGLDIEPRRIEKISELSHASNLENISVFCGELKELPKEKKFDLIYSIDVFEHILEKEMPFSEAVKRLNKGGQLLIKMPSRKQLTVLPEQWFQSHQAWLEEEHIGQVYELADLEKRMKKEGLEIQYAGYGDGITSRLAWELGYLSKKAGPFLQLLSLPFLKGLVLLDQWIHADSVKGNTIQVIGIKN